MSPAARWVLAIVGLLAANVLAMVVLAVTSSVDRPEVIPEYYQRAAHYDDEIDQAAANRALAWQATARVDRDTIAVDVRDASGAPLVGAEVRVAGYQRAHATDAYDVALPAVAPGRYRADHAGRLGTHDLEIVVVRGAARFVARRTVEIR